MRLLFTTSLSVSQSSSSDNDLVFLQEIARDIKKLVEHYPEGLYPVTVALALEFETEASTTEQIELTLEGTVIYIYIKMFKEPYPVMPFTDLQRERINAIWSGIGHPENIIPT